MTNLISIIFSYIVLRKRQLLIAFLVLIFSVPSIVLGHGASFHRDITTSTVVNRQNTNSDFNTEMEQDVNGDYLSQSIINGSTDEDLARWKFGPHTWSHGDDNYDYPGVWPQDYFDLLYKRAVSDYNSNDKVNAYWWLGRSLHLVEDATCPDHINTFHWPARFEHWESDNWLSYYNGDKKAYLESIDKIDAWPNPVDVAADETRDYAPLVEINAYNPPPLWIYVPGREETYAVWRYRATNNSVSYGAGVIDQFWNDTHSLNPGLPDGGDDDGGGGGGEGSPPGGGGSPGSDGGWPPGGGGTGGGGTGGGGTGGGGAGKIGKPPGIGKIVFDNIMGYVRGYWDLVCSPYDLLFPINQHPDDNYSNATSLLTFPNNNSVSPIVRTAIKKNKVGTLYYKAGYDLSTEYKAAQLFASDAEIKSYEVRLEALSLHMEQNRFAYWQDYLESPDVAILNNGYPKESIALLAKYFETISIIDTDFDPILADSHPVLLIPTGGLLGLDTSEVFKTKLAEYVSRGGTIIAFTQEKGYEFGALPGCEVRGYGWREDQACFRASVVMDSFHPILSGQSSSSLDIGVDGFFTDWPENAQVILRRKVNGYPAMIAYPYGQGTVVVTTAYSDWGLGFGAITPDEKALIRDAVSWAKNTTAIPEYETGQSVDIPLTIKNITDRTATQVELKLLSPDRYQIHSETHSLQVVSDQQVSYAWSHSAPSFLGVYFVDYVLKDDDGNIIQPQAEGDRFIVKTFQPTEGGYVNSGLPLTLFVTMPDERVLTGTEATFVGHVINNGSESITIGSGSEQVTVPSQEERTITRTQTVGMPGKYLYAMEFNNAIGQNVGSASIYYFVIPAAVDVNIFSPEIVGNSVVFDVSSTNLTTGRFYPTIKTEVSGPLGTTILNQTQSLDLLGGSQDIRRYSLQLPATGKYGTYHISSDVYYGDLKIGTNKSSFEIPAPDPIIDLVSTEHIGNTLKANFQIENRSLLPLSQGAFSVALKDPSGQSIWTGLVQVNIEAGQSVTHSLAIPVANISFGQYEIWASIECDNLVREATFKVPCSVAAKVTFDKPKYFVRDQVNFNVDMTNDGKFTEPLEVDVSIPDVGYANTQNFTLSSGQSRTMPCQATLPSIYSGGGHPVIVTSRMGTSSSSKTFLFQVPYSNLSLSLNKTSYLAGETGTVFLRNTGGLDTTYRLNLILSDSKDQGIQEETLQGEILAGEEKSVTVTIPQQALEGAYYLTVDADNIDLNKTTRLGQVLIVSGVSATEASITDKESYLSSEQVKVLTHLTNGGLPVTGSSLNFKVLTGPIPAGPSLVKKWGTKGQLDTLEDIASDRFGNTYVLDSGNDRIEKFDAYGTPVTTYGIYGMGDGQFYDAAGIAVDSQGNIYVADTNNHRVQKIDPNGVFLAKWGSYGTAGGQFAYPSDVTIDLEGNVWVSDTYNFRVQKFLTDGTYLGQFPAGSQGTYSYNPKRIATDEDGNVLVGISSSISSRVQKFTASGTLLQTTNISASPGGLFVDRTTNNFYVTYPTQNRVEKFSQTGSSLGTWGSSGQGNGQFANPTGIALDSLGAVLVCDSTNQRVQTFTDMGAFSTLWPTVGAGAGTFYDPYGIDEDTSGFIYITDARNSRVQKFDMNGNFISTFGTPGTGSGQFGFPYAVAVGQSNSLYVVDDNRVQKFDSTGQYVSKWGTSGTGNGQFNTPEGVATDPEGNVYVSDTFNNRVQVFDPNGVFIRKWGSYGTANDQLRSPLGIDVDSFGNVYVADWGNNKIKKFSNTGTHISSISGEFFDVATSLDGSVFAVKTSGVFQFDSNGTLVRSFGTYGTGDEQFKNPKGILVTQTGDIYVADTSNNRIKKYQIGSGGRQTLYESSEAISLAPLEERDLSKAIGFLSHSGKLYLESELTSGTGQVISSSSYPFYVTSSSISMKMTTDKRVYKPGEPVVITGEVKNGSSNPLVGNNILINLGSSTVLSQPVSLLNPGETLTFQATTSSPDSDFNLDGYFDGVHVNDTVDVSPPSLTAEICAPSVVGLAPFDLDLALKNRGETDIEETVSCSLSGLNETVTIPAGQTMLIKRTAQIMADTTYEYVLTGDVSQTLIKQISCGESTTVDLFPSPVYKEGGVSIPYTVQNTGSLETAFDLIFDLSGAPTVTKTVSLSPGSALNGDIDLGSLVKGDYTLNYSSPFGQGSKSFQVRRDDDVSLTSSTSVSGSDIYVSTSALNDGFNDISGYLRVYSSFDSKEESVSLVRGATGSFVFTLNGEAAQPGLYDLKVGLYDTSGRLLKEEVKQIDIKAPSFSASSVPSGANYSIGQTAHMSFTVTNTGNIEGKAKLFLDLPGIFSEEREVFLEAGEAKDVTFACLIPDDLEEKDYPASLTIDGKKQEFSFHVSGITLSVDASLNGVSYSAGETAILTVNVNNESGIEPLNMFAKVQYQNYEETQHFSLSSRTLVFEIPVGEGQDRVTYGIYTESGRSMYINTTYIRGENPALTLTPDKPLYSAGETVNVSIDSTESGTMRVNGPNYIEDVAVSPGTSSLSFAIPSDFNSGTYMIDYSLDDISGSVPIDVKGYSVKVSEAILNKGLCNAQDTVLLTLDVSTEDAFEGLVTGWLYDEEGNSQKVFEATRNFISGDNSFEFSGGFSTTHPGLHRLVYGVYRSGTPLLLASGQEALDVIGASLIATSTNEVDYPGVNEPVQMLLDAYGTGEANLQVLVNDGLVKEETVSLNGYTRLTTSLGVFLPGTHTVKARLTQAGLTSEKSTQFIYGSSLPDLNLSYQDIELDTEGAPDASAVPLEATIHNSGKTDAQNVLVRFFDGDPTQGALQIGADVVLSSLPSGDEAVAQVVVDTNTFYGLHTIYVVVDPENTVQELNGNNNSSSLSIPIYKSDASLNPLVPDGLNGWYKSPVTVTLSAGDNANDIARIEYAIDTTTAWTTYTSPFTVLKEELTNVFYRSVDNTGRVGATETINFRIDSLKPQTRVFLSALPDGLNNWYKTIPSVTLSGFDAQSGSGFDKTYFRWDNSAETLYTGAVSPPEGTHTLYYYSEDLAGNKEDEGSTEFKVDTTPPEQPLISSPQDKAVCTNPVSVSGTAGAGTYVDLLMDGISASSTLADLLGSWQTEITMPEGSHVLTAMSYDQAGNGTTSTSPVHLYVKYSTQLSFDSSCDKTGQFSDSMHLSAVLLSPQGLLSGETIVFTLGGQTVSAQTDAAGKAEATILLSQEAGTYVLEATFEGDSEYKESNASQGFEITKEDTEITYLGDHLASIVGTTLLSAKLTDQDSGNLVANKTVTFSLGAQSISAVTDSDGVADAFLPITQPQGIYTLSASFAEDASFLSSMSDPSWFVVYDPFSGEEASGGGYMLRNGNKCNFGFNAEYSNGEPTPSGELQYKDHGTGLNIHSMSFSWLVFSGQSATLSGSCLVDGMSGYTFRLESTDVAEPGKGHDTFALTIYNQNNAQFYMVQGILSQGNLKVQ